MKVPYVCYSKKFEEHYTNQSGSGIPHYEGISFQRGYGLGGVFRRLFRAALPFLVRGGKVVGKEALVTGTKVINDVYLEMTLKLLQEAGKSLARKAINRVQSMIGSPECVKSELELFHLPATQTAIEDGHWDEFHPLSNVFDGGPVEFHLSGSGEDYESNPTLCKSKDRCVDNDAFHGTFEKSPFDFKHYHMNFIGIYVDGQPKPHAPLELNFDKNNCIKGYHSLFTGTEKIGHDQGLFISREDYIKGNTLFAFNLSPDLCNGDHLNLIKQSNLRLEIKFSQSLSQTMRVIIFAEFDNVIEIYKTGNVLVDFGN
ncbi:uncharacterized protein F54H12.2 [Caerostris extrusa]|uniref:Uncharacterized protein F54H12.2 n=1 Tax=Caerostris extrusa TaxID=172846 RepID=A0AAV4RL24_CAEEX|nr:uncharacterized protein F54H12.2 [Caerostris extrusa]